MHGMSVFRTVIFGSLALATLTAFAAPARADWHWRHGPHGWVRFWVAPGVVVAPPPVYYAPPLVYYAPPLSCTRHRRSPMSRRLGLGSACTSTERWPASINFAGRF